MQKKFQEIFFNFEIISFELVALNTGFYWERILLIGCQYVNKESQCQILLKMIYSSWFSLREIKKYGKNTAMQIYAVFRTL